MSKFGLFRVAARGWLILQVGYVNYTK